MKYYIRNTYVKVSNSTYVTSIQQNEAKKINSENITWSNREKFNIAIAKMNNGIAL